MAVSITNKDSGESVQLIAKPKVGESTAILAAIRKKKGEKVVMIGSAIPMPERLPTGIFEFDLMTGGGFPYNRMSILYGPEGGGKTNHALKAASILQKTDKHANKVVLVDIEGTYESKWASELGVNADELLVVKPGYGEEAVDIADALVRADDVGLIIIDSLAAMVSSKEVGVSTEKADVGTTPMLAKRMSNKMAVALSEESKRGHEVAVIFINRISYEIGKMFGDPEKQPGGKAVQFNSSLTVRLAGKPKMDKSISAEVPVFRETTARLKKAKVGVLRMETEYDFAIMATPSTVPGETRSWNMVSNRLKELGILKKGEKGGWELEGKTFQTLVMIEDLYYGEDDYKLHLQKMVIDSYKGSAMLVAE